MAKKKYDAGIISYLRKLSQQDSERVSESLRLFASILPNSNENTTNISTTAAELSKRSVAADLSAILETTGAIEMVLTGSDYNTAKTVAVLRSTYGVLLPYLPLSVHID